MLFLLLFLSIIFAKIEIYVIPHTHIDQGWLNTIDGYRGVVHHILDQVVTQMQNGADRTFNWGEVYYFKSWYTGLEDIRKKYVRNLIERGRFSFVHNGWVENDEACPTFSAIVDQLTYGVEYLRNEFGIEPRIAWEIDPFGHDRRMIDVLSDMGFEAMVLNRVHFRIKDLMRNNKLYEFIWESGRKKIFCHTLFKHYSAPRTFDFEDSSSRITSSNVQRRAESLMDHFRTMRNSHLTDHVLVPLGDDFKFQRANVQYENWDLLMKYINEHHGDKFHVRYATAQEYFDNLQKQSVDFPIVTHDFFPYMDHEDAWWSGFYTTHPLMKHRIREAEGWKHHGEVAASLEMALGGKFKDREDALIMNREEVGVAQHHDYITGTSKKHVIQDYIGRMNRAVVRSREMVSDIITKIFNHGSEDEKVLGRYYLGDKLFDHGFGDSNADDVLLEGQHRVFVAFNSILSERLELVEFLTNSPNVVIKAYVGGMDSPLDIRDIQVVPKIFNHGGSLRGVNDREEYLVYFYLPMKGLSMTRFDVEVLPKSDVHPNDVHNMLYQDRVPNKSPLPSYSEGNVGETFFKHYIQDEVEKKFAVENDHYRIELEIEGELYTFRITDHKTQIVHETKDELFNYFQTQKSGAYLFRPNGWPGKFHDVLVQNVFLTHGDVVSQMTITTRRYVVRFTLPRHIHSNFDDETYISNGRFIRTEIHVNEMSNNQELVFRVPLKSDPTVVPDLYGYDGLYFRKRKFDDSSFGKHPVAGKFFPSPQGGALVGKDSQVFVLNSASQAMGAKHGESDGKEDEIMFMIHRRLMTDDFRGMSQANNDNSHLDTIFYLRYDSSDSDPDPEKFSEVQKAGEGLARKVPIFIFEHYEMNNVQDRLWKYFSPIVHSSTRNEHYEKFLALMNMEVLEQDVIGLRIHNMRYEDHQFIDLESLFNFNAFVGLKDIGLGYTEYEKVVYTKNLVNSRYPRENSYTRMSIHNGKQTVPDQEARAESGLFVGQGEDEKSYVDYTFLKNTESVGYAKSLVRASEIRSWKITDWKIDKSTCFETSVGKKEGDIVEIRKEKKETEKNPMQKLIDKAREVEKKDDKFEVRKEKWEEEEEEEKGYTFNNLHERHKKPPPPPPEPQPDTKEEREISNEPKILLYEVRSSGSSFSGRLIFFYFIVLVSGVMCLSYVYDKAIKNRKRDKFGAPKKSRIATVRVAGRRKAKV